MYYSLHALDMANNLGDSVLNVLLQLRGMNWLPILHGNSVSTLLIATLVRGTHPQGMLQQVSLRCLRVQGELRCKLLKQKIQPVPGLPTRHIPGNTAQNFRHTNTVSRVARQDNHESTRFPFSMSFSQQLRLQDVNRHTDQPASRLRLTNTAQDVLVRAAAEMGACPVKGD